MLLLFLDNSRFGGIQCLGSMNSTSQCAEGGPSSPSKCRYDHSLLSKPTWSRCLFLTINRKRKGWIEANKIAKNDLTGNKLVSFQSTNLRRLMHLYGAKNLFSYTLLMQNHHEKLKINKPWWHWLYKSTTYLTKCRNLKKRTNSNFFN